MYDNAKRSNVKANKETIPHDYEVYKNKRFKKKKFK